MLDARHIYPLTDFLRNHKAHVARVHDERVSEVLTVNGKAQLVLLAPEAFQEMQERLYRAETIAAIREGLAAADRGELKPANQVLDEMKAKYGLPH
jgi:PHD/YefM family antitoxin component YafN of YafNO toxin-antitoxin module